jgi:hypothetical protein
VISRACKSRLCGFPLLQAEPIVLAVERVGQGFPSAICQINESPEIFLAEPSLGLRRIRTRFTRQL